MLVFWLVCLWERNGTRHGCSALNETKSAFREKNSNFHPTPVLPCDRSPFRSYIPSVVMGQVIHTTFTVPTCLYDNVITVCCRANTQCSLCTFYMLFCEVVSVIYILISKLVPHPQLLVASGLSTILNCDPINSIVKSTLLPFSKSSDGWSSIILGAVKSPPCPSSAEYVKMVSSSRTSPDSAPSPGCSLASAPAAGLGGSDSGSVTRLMRYWKPWQPPDSTWMRRARCGLLSLRIMSLRRCSSERTGCQYTNPCSMVKTGRNRLNR